MRTFRGLIVQVRVLNALVLRELATRFGARGAGILWALMEPIAQTAVFVFLRSVMGAPIHRGMEIVPFIFTGVISFFSFRLVANKVIGTVRSRRGLLFFPQVTPLDTLLGRALMEIGLVLLAFGVFYFGLRVFDLAPAIQYPLLVLLCLLIGNGLGIGYGLTIEALGNFVPAIRQVSGIFLRILFFLSGIFYVVPEIPPTWRAWLTYNPMLQLCELLRDAFFEAYRTDYGSFNYVLWWLAGLLAVGLLLERQTRLRATEVN